MTALRNDMTCGERRAGRAAHSHSHGHAFGLTLMVVGLAVLAIALWRASLGAAGDGPLAAAFLITAAGILAMRHTSARDSRDAC